MYHSFEHGWEKERMEEAIKALEHDRLVRRLRMASRSAHMESRESTGIRGVAFLTALFRGW